MERKREREREREGKERRERTLLLPTLRLFDGDNTFLFVGKVDSMGVEGKDVQENGAPRTMKKNCGRKTKKQ